MESEGENKPKEQQESDSSPQGGGAKRRNAQAAGPQVIGTDDPAIVPGPACPSNWIGQPDDIMSIETSRIRGPSEPFNPNIILVPIESDRPRQDRSKGPEGGKKSGDGSKQQGDEQENQNGGESGGQKKGGKEASGKHDGKSNEGKDGSAQENGGKSQGEKGKGQKHNGSEGNGSNQGSQPSLVRMLLYSAGISLLCSIIVAGAMVYFFGGSSEGKSSGKGSSSSKGKDSDKSKSKSEGQDSSQGSDSGEESGAGESSDTSKNSIPGQSPAKKKSESAKLLEAQAAWLTAMNELHEAKEAEKQARRSERITRSVIDFLKNTLLSAGHPGSVSLPQAFWAGGQGKDVTLRKALDASEAHVAEAFANSPLAEATAREILGLAYLNLGDAAQAVKEYERALALRQATGRIFDPETATCRNQLAVAYRLAGNAREGARLFEDNPTSPAHAEALAVEADMLLSQKKAAEAELKLRECLAIREKTQSDDWKTFDTKSTLGEALLDQRKFAEAEPLLLAGYEGLKEREDSIPPESRNRLTKALERLAKLYELWGREETAARWRDELRTIGNKVMSATKK